MDIGERPPVEGVEGQAVASQPNVAEENLWSPNEEFVKALLDMGVSRNAAEKVWFSIALAADLFLPFAGGLPVL